MPQATISFHLCPAGLPMNLYHPISRFVPGSIVCAGLGLALLLAFAPLPAGGSDLLGQPRLRHPVALAFAPEGAHLLAANSASGTVSVVDWTRQATVAEFAVARQLSDLAHATNDLYLATDEAAHQLILLRHEGGQLSILERLPVSPYPVEVVYDAARRRAFVASLWSRRLTIVQFDSADDRLHVERVVDLDFPPRKMTLLGDGQRLIIADAFIGRLAVYDTDGHVVEMSRDFFGHNVRGLAQSADRRMLLIGHQMLNELAHTVHNDVHWGLLMSNDLRWLRLDSLLDAEKTLYAGGHMHPVGEANDAAADPNEVAVAPDGTAVVALGGVNQIGVGRETDFRLERHNVGRRPTAVAIAPDGNTVAIANTFDDTITLFDLAQRQESACISLGPRPTLTAAHRGEQLFYDGSQSLEGWMSCHSCHTDGHTGGLLNDNFSDGSFGAPKRVLSLLNAHQTAPYAWNGKVATLEQQIAQSTNRTMQRSEPIATEDVDALAAYLRTLQVPESLAELRGTADPAAIARGREVFAARSCSDCHAPPHYTTPEAYDVGLSDKHGNRRYNPPSLRGLSHRRAFFHDARARNLADVFQIHGHQVEDGLSEQELSDLLAFLGSL